MDLMLLLLQDNSTNSTELQLTDEESAAVTPISMFIIAMKTSLHTTCAIFTARSDNFYHWFAPIFTAEAVVNTLLFVYEFLFNYYLELLSESFCNLLVHEMHFLSSSMIFLYVWAIYYFLFQENEYRVHPFAFFIFSLFMVVAMAASIIDAVLTNPSICKTKNFSGFAFVYMIAAAIVVYLSFLVLIGWCACASHSDNSDKRTWFIVLFTAVGVRVLGLEVFTHHFISQLTAYCMIAVRTISLIYPIVFLLVAKGRLVRHYRILSGSEID